MRNVIYMSFYKQKGFSLVELLVAAVIALIVLAAMNGVLSQALQTKQVTQSENESVQAARFAMDKIIREVSHSRMLFLPLIDKPNTNWPENIREQTVPATAPIGDSTLATAVLAIALPTDRDLDGDGFSDADDDRDGKIDEDLPSDIFNDTESGIWLIDDDGGGSVDEGSYNASDDESVTENDDPINGIDDDNDNNVDEDPAADNNGDSCPGICGVDDDNDGSIDEGNINDDDEDGLQDEDWYNPIVFYLDDGSLKERVPVPWDENGANGVTGQDFIVSVLAENVTRFRVERIEQENNRHQLIEITLEVMSSNDGTFSLTTRVRVGGSL